MLYKLDNKDVKTVQYINNCFKLLETFIICTSLITLPRIMHFNFFKQAYLHVHNGNIGINSWTGMKITLRHYTQ